jgi:hypothetical protein
MKNLAASVRTRLLNLSRERGEPLDRLMEQYATGRFLYRLAESEYRDRFVLKGAQLFRVWSAEHHRPTRDLDLLGFGDSSEATIKSVFTELVQMPIDPPDGLLWGNIETGAIRDDLTYGGVRAVLTVHLAGARISLQIDVGFGDAITPEAIMTDWRELLDFPVARLLAYPPETVIAEKLQAAVTLGLQNSRMKDFFDLHWLREHQSFDGGLLLAAVEATFVRRGTVIPSTPPTALSEVFSRDDGKTLQWNAFRKKGQLDAPELPEVIARLSEFLLPIFSGEVRGQIWHPHSGWTTESS